MASCISQSVTEVTGRALQQSKLDTSYCAISSVIVQPFQELGIHFSPSSTSLVCTSTSINCSIFFSWKNPQPSYSVKREASFGFGQLSIANATHALWSWHRNQDVDEVTADEVWLTNLRAVPQCTRKA